MSDTSIRPTLAVREADMFHKQARFWVGEFDGEKECAAGNEVSAIGFLFVVWVLEKEWFVVLRFNFVEVEVFRRHWRPSERASFNEVKS